LRAIRRTLASTAGCATADRGLPHRKRIGGAFVQRDRAIAVVRAQVVQAVAGSVDAVRVFVEVSRPGLAEQVVAGSDRRNGAGAHCRTPTQLEQIERPRRPCTHQTLRAGIDNATVEGLDDRAGMRQAGVPDRSRLSRSCAFVMVEAGKRSKRAEAQRAGRVPQARVVDSEKVGACRQAASAIACDFLAVETICLRWLYALFFIELGTRRVPCAGARGADRRQRSAARVPTGVTCRGRFGAQAAGPRQEPAASHQASSPA